MEFLCLFGLFGFDLHPSHNLHNQDGLLIHEDEGKHTHFITGVVMVLNHSFLFGGGAHFLLDFHLIPHGQGCLIDHCPPIVEA